MRAFPYADLLDLPKVEGVTKERMIPAMSICILYVGGCALLAQRHDMESAK